jgi:hypothetical protein
VGQTAAKGHLVGEHLVAEATDWGHPCDFGLLVTGAFSLLDRFMGMRAHPESSRRAITLPVPGDMGNEIGRTSCSDHGRGLRAELRRQGSSRRGQGKS